MSRTARAIAASAALLFSLHMVSLHAQKGHGSTSHPTKTQTAKAPAPKGPSTKPSAGAHTTTHQSSPKGGGATAMTPKGASAKATKPADHKTAKATAPTTEKGATAKGGKKDTKAEVTAKKSETKKSDTKTASAKDKKKTATTASTNTTTPSTETGTTPTTQTPLTPVQEKLQKNTNLATKLQARLPAGTNLMEAADGFRNLGQFVAAVNVSHNLNIPFDQLKADMVTKKMSLGQSIQDLRPATSASVEAQRAEYDAQGMIAQTEESTSLSATANANVTTTTTTTTTTTAKKTRSTAQPRKGRKTSATGGL